MAVPTVATVTPATGAPTGGQLVQVIGTNFRLPTAPGAGVPVPVAPPSVRVTFGGVEAPEVRVISATRLLVTTPKRTLPFDSNGRTLANELVDLVVENIDDSGVLIPTETVTVADAYDYIRPGIGYDAGKQGIIRVCETFMELLRSEVLANTVLETSVDYDPDTATAVIEGVRVPQLVLTGPEITFNSLFTNRGSYVVDGINADEGFRRRRHRVVDLGFEIIGVTKSAVQLINLIELLELVIDRNKTLQFECTPGQGDFIGLELNWTGDPRYERQPANPGLASSLRVFRCSVELRGYPLTTLPGVDQDAIQDVGYAVDQVVLDAPLQIGDNLPATQGAPTRSPPDSGVPTVNPPQGGPTRSPPDSGAQE